MPEKTVKVRVKPPFRVVHEGKPHTDGDVLTVNEDVAGQWVRSGFVERVTGKP